MLPQICFDGAGLENILIRGSADWGSADWGSADWGSADRRFCWSEILSIGDSVE